MRKYDAPIKVTKPVEVTASSQCNAVDRFDKFNDLGAATKLFIFLVQVYQVSIDGLRTVFGVSLSCNFVPSCSQYTKASIQKHGAWHGSILGLKRILRCHPFHQSGIDLPS